MTRMINSLSNHEAEWIVTLRDTLDSRDAITEAWREENDGETELTRSRIVRIDERNFVSE